ncbi:MAG: outer membrane lipoprotein carrier protein LolA [Prevotella sp.]|nr:outer membrane lipoprotein carrier protein LolA [Prevotella sp.]MBR6264493.1 outer membrane lipoprotein carrier protein LolA [Prevotella sp.]
MMKHCLILLFTIFFCIQVSGQTRLTAEQQNQVIAKLDKAASAVKSMQCEFIQTKKMKMLKKEMQSTGMMYYKSPNKLRWQYTSPYDYTFILNGDKVRIKSSKTNQNINVQDNKMFRQITNIILNSMTGKGLNNSSDFTVEVYKNGNYFFAKLYPKKKELKQIYQVIEIYFNATLTMVSSVKLEEKTGDVTWVRLYNANTSVTLNESLFNTN